MKLGDLHAAAGSAKARKRRGKGAATGLGGPGGKIPAWFEGGQMPIQRRVPKRGFKNPGHVTYQVVQVGRLANAPKGAVVDREWLKAQRIVRRPGPIKLLAGGDLKVALTVKVDAASAGAKAAVEKAGGTVETPAVQA